MRPERQIVDQNSLGHALSFPLPLWSGFRFSARPIAEHIDLLLQAGRCGKCGWRPRSPSHSLRQDLPALGLLFYGFDGTGDKLMKVNVTRIPTGPTHSFEHSRSIGA
jgi:hypothetical protein